MSVPKVEVLHTPGEYLAMEREAFERHEWLDGLIYAMAGESPEHSLIGTNALTTLGVQLRGKLKSIECSLPLADVYDRIEFPAATEDDVLG